MRSRTTWPTHRPFPTIPVRTVLRRAGADPWNFLPCGSLCGETAAPFQAKGGLNAPEAWDILKQRGAAFGREARVAVLDTGIAYMNKKPQFRRAPISPGTSFSPDTTSSTRTSCRWMRTGTAPSPARSPSATTTTSG